MTTFQPWGINDSIWVFQSLLFLALLSVSVVFVDIHLGTTTSTIKVLTEEKNGNERSTLLYFYFLNQEAATSITMTTTALAVDESEDCNPPG